MTFPAESTSTNVSSTSTPAVDSVASTLTSSSATSAMTFPAESTSTNVSSTSTAVPVVRSTPTMSVPSTLTDTPSDRSTPTSSPPRRSTSVLPVGPTSTPTSPVSTFIPVTGSISRPIPNRPKIESNIIVMLHFLCINREDKLSHKIYIYSIFTLPLFK